MSMQRDFWKSLLCLAGFLAGASPAIAAEPSYDIVIRGGTVYDGSGKKPYAGDVAISGDRIVAVGKVGDGQAKRVIDARGLAVAPGFIDMNSFSGDVILDDNRALSSLYPNTLIGQGDVRQAQSVFGRHEVRPGEWHGRHLGRQAHQRDAGPDRARTWQDRGLTTDEGIAASAACKTGPL